MLCMPCERDRPNNKLSCSQSLPLLLVPRSRIRLVTRCRAECYHSTNIAVGGITHGKNVTLHVPITNWQNSSSNGAVLHARAQYLVIPSKELLRQREPK